MEIHNNLKNDDLFFLRRSTSGEILRAKRRQRPIVQNSGSGNVMPTFSSIKEAARVVEVNPTSINGALTGKQKTSAGYKWEYLKK